MKLSRIAAAALGIAATAGLALTATPAFAANSVTQYCLDHGYDITAQQAQGTGQNGANQPLWCQTQFYVENWGYTGPVNGVPGPNTWAGIQRLVKAYGGYTGPVNGVPGPNTYNAMKRFAAPYWGYTPAYTPVYNGTLSARDWQAWGAAMRPGD